MEQATLKLIKRLEKIAADSNERFRYFLEIQPRRKGNVFRFFVADDLTELLAGAGATESAAVLDLEVHLAAKIEEYGWKDES